jgi:pilus assembly protein CpaB
VLLLVGYVRGAEERALAGEELVPVLVADQPIEKGASSEALIAAVRIEQVPTKVRADDAVSDLSQIDGLAAAVDLVPGEQLLQSRFIQPQALEASRRVEAPPGLLEVTFSLNPERAVGGQLTPGDLVVVFASFDPFEANAIEYGEDGIIGAGEALDPDGDGITLLGTTDGEEGTGSLRTPNTTKLILHKILVTNVQVEQLPRQPEEGTDPATVPDLAPTGNLLITLAMAPEDAQRVVFTAEHGFVWLGSEDETAPEPGTDVENRATVYR